MTNQKLQLVITVQVVGENYRNLAGRELVMRDLAGHRDISAVSYSLGETVARMVDTLATELNPKAPRDEDAADGTEEIE
jgi:hypothetical protein